MAKSVEINRWIEATWCPDPHSKKQMGYHYALASNRGELIVVLYKKSKPFQIAELPPFICNIGDLQLLHEAGADVDVKIEGSFRDKRKIKIALYIDHRQVEKFASQVKEAKAKERAARKQQTDEIKALEEQKTLKKKARWNNARSLARKTLTLSVLVAKSVWKKLFSTTGQ